MKIDCQVDNLNCSLYLFFLVLLPLAHEYIKEFGCEFNKQKFKGLFDEVMRYIYGEETVAIAPLENFELEGAEEVTIGNKYRIRKLTEWEIKQLIRLGYANSLGLIIKPDLGVIENTWCIEVTYNTQKENIPDMDEFITLMRLFKRGYVSSSIILRYPKKGKFSYVSAPQSSHCIYSQRSKYVLKLDELDRLRQLWNLYYRVKEKLPQELSTDLRWFNKSYEEIEDRVLDLDIAFQTMFKCDRYDHMIKSKLISINLNEIEKIYKDLYNFKRQRNLIAHQGLSSLNPDKLESITANAEEIFREYYRWFLEQIDMGRDYYEIISKPRR